MTKKNEQQYYYYSTIIAFMEYVHLKKIIYEKFIEKK